MCGTANPSWSKAKYAARGVHLDEDTAGRRLESMGDHVRREMIVRITKVLRQNPAYRPFATNKQPSEQSCRRVVCIAECSPIQRPDTMHRRAITLSPVLC